MTRLFQSRATMGRRRNNTCYCRGRPQVLKKKNGAMMTVPARMSAMALIMASIVFTRTADAAILTATEFATGPAGDRANNHPSGVSNGPSSYREAVSKYGVPAIGPFLAADAQSSVSSRPRGRSSLVMRPPSEIANTTASAIQANGANHLASFHRHWSGTVQLTDRRTGPHIVAGQVLRELTALPNESLFVSHSPRLGTDEGLVLPSYSRPQGGAGEVPVNVGLGLVNALPPQSILIGPHRSQELPPLSHVPSQAIDHSASPVFQADVIEASVTPEPASALVWAGMGAFATGLVCLRRILVPMSFSSPRR